MKAFSLPATLRLLCALLLAVAVVAGPCQACFDPPQGDPAHDCCPSSKKSERHQHNSSCSDVQVAVDQGKLDCTTLDLIAEPVASRHVVLALHASDVVVEAARFAAFTPPLLTTLRC